MLRDLSAIAWMEVPDIELDFARFPTGFIRVGQTNWPEIGPEGTERTTPCT